MWNSSVIKNWHLTQMNYSPQDVYEQLHTYGQTLAQITAAYVAAFPGVVYSLDDVEKLLGLLVDQALVVRTVGDRTTALYYYTV